MPADQETIRYTGVYGDDADGRPYLMREVLGGGSGGRPYADGEDTIHVVPDSRNIPVEFAESRLPFLVERLGLAVDSGGPGRYRGGLGYEKHIRMLRDAHFMSIADRSILACWGVAGGRAGRPFEVVDRPRRPGRAGRRRAGRRRAGAGRRGHPHPHHRRRRLGRPAGPRLDEVVRDVAWGKVSLAGARDDYGVVVGGTSDEPELDEAASDALRAARRAARTGAGTVLRPRPRVWDARRAANR